MSFIHFYPDNFEEKIGFSKIRELLKQYCSSELGRKKVENLRVQKDLEKIKHQLNQLEELIRLVHEEGNTLPEQGYFDLKKEIHELSAENSWWEIDTFIGLRSLLRTSKELLSILHKHETLYLRELYSTIAFPVPLLRDLEKVFTDKGEVDDHASPELNKLRKQLDQNQQQIRKTINLIFRNARSEGWVPEGASITVRDGRMVIPLFAEAKRRIKGFVHDESATGQTVYIEPTAVLEGNNRQRELEYEERREVIKILKRLSREVNENRNVLFDIIYFLGEIDFLRAKMRLADRLKAIKPETIEQPVIKIRQARHPLLIITDHDIVPLDLELTEGQRVILISGPNAGGKSVALKTVAMLQFMFQAGLYIPANEGSIFGVFTKIFIDIGDEQSIENDLSTYSSHLHNMRHMIEHVDASSLVLIDEFGSGTEPQFGGALAESILSKLMKESIKGIITTHYANLKSYAENRDGIVNAAMRFDMKNLRPLYQLSVGKPGSSHALEIARNTGLPDDVISKAKDLLGREMVEYDKALSNLQEQLRSIQEREKTLERREEESLKIINEYKRLKEDIDKSQKQILNKAKEEAATLVAKANREIEKTIRHIKENKAEKKETKRIREQLSSFKEKHKKAEREEKEVDLSPIKKGDIVEVIGSSAAGEVIDIQGKKAEVRIGDLKSLIKIDRLKKTSKREIKKTQATRRATADISSKVMEFRSTLDIRGKRAEEALPLVDKYLDDALLAGAQEIKILHGKGNGVLKDLVRNHLKGYSRIERVADEHIERGGAGITVVTLEE
ncbi:MAG: endonuclease MutS2 [Candidatus Cyclobacteriaceae bacterium M2_1C_046]